MGIFPLVGKREVYENADAMAQDTLKDSVMTRVIEDFGRRVLAQ